MLVIQLGVVDGCRGSKSLVELTMPVSALIGGYFKEKTAYLRSIKVFH